jgi:shikimate kinase
MPDSQPDNIILCGFMGTGKTTVGKLIAAKMGWQFVDTDQVIEARQGQTVSAIFAEAGESAFRQMESALCVEMIGWRQTVIATGGGIVLREENRANLNRAGLVVCLDAPADEIVARLSGATDRPLLAGDNPTVRIAELLAARESVYGALPCHVHTAGHAPHEIAEAIIALWKQIPDNAMR